MYFNVTSDNGTATAVESSVKNPESVSLIVKTPFCSVTPDQRRSLVSSGSDTKIREEKKVYLVT